MRKGSAEIFVQKICAQARKHGQVRQVRCDQAGVDPTERTWHWDKRLVWKAQTLSGLGPHGDFLVGDFTAMVATPRAQSEKNKTRPPLNA